MSDVTPQPTNQTAPPPATDASAALPPAAAPGPVPYERFTEVNKRAGELAARLEALEKQQKDAETQAMSEQGKWKELAEQRTAELEKERLERIRLNVALKTGLPAEFAGRLMGKTEEELTADAATLLPLVRPQTPGNPPAPSRAPTTAFTAEQLRDPAFVRKNKAEILKQNRS